jgi:hypothetical protein
VLHLQLVRAWAETFEGCCMQDGGESPGGCVLNTGHDGGCFDGQCLYHHPVTGDRCTMPTALATGEHWNGATTDHEFGDPRTSRERVVRA